MKGVWSSVHVTLYRKLRKKNRVGMALNVATLPLILYCKEVKKPYEQVEKVKK